MASEFVSDLNAVRHYHSSAFLSHRSRVARTHKVTSPQMFALPGSLVPIHRDRIEAHHEDGLSTDELVAYENKKFITTNVRVRERHKKWVNGTYSAVVALERELKAEKMKREMDAAAEYQRRLAQMLANRES